MATNILGINVAAPIYPYTTDDAFATHDEQYGLGGTRSVANIAERNAITTERRKQGMTVYVRETDETWRLKTGITNNDWMLVEYGSGGGSSGFSGYSGPGGTVGSSGFSGYSGSVGFSGFSGLSSSGFSGYSGYSGPHPYVISCTYNDLINADPSFVLLRHPLTVPVNFLQNLPDSKGCLDVTPATTLNFDIRRSIDSGSSSSSIGTMIFANGGQTATFTFALAVSCAVGDIIYVLCPAIADGNAQGLGFSLLGWR